MAKYGGKEMYGSDTDLPITDKGVTESFEAYHKLCKAGHLRLESRLTRRQVHEIINEGTLLQDNSGDTTYSLAEIIIEQVEGNEWLMKKPISLSEYGWERSKLQRIAVSDGDYDRSGVDESDDLTIYMRSIRDHPIYSLEGQIALGRRMRQGDMQARNMLVVGTLRLVARTARDYHYKSHKRISIMDFVGWGNELLMKATLTYDPDKGAFTTYVMSILQRELYEKIHGYIRNLKMPSGTSHKVWELRKEINHFTAEHTREPTIEELVHSMNWDEAKVRRVYDIHMLEKMPVVFAGVQQKRPPGPERDERDLKEEHDKPLIPSKRFPSAEKVYREKELKAGVDIMLSHLNPTEQRVLRVLNGVGDEELTMRDAEEVIGKTRGRIDQVNQIARKKILGNPRAVRRVEHFLGGTRAVNKVR